MFTLLFAFIHVSYKITLVLQVRNNITLNRAGITLRIKVAHHKPDAAQYKPEVLFSVDHVPDAREK